MVYLLAMLLIIHGIVCLVGAFFPLYPPVFFFYAFFPGHFVVKLIIVLLAGAAQLAYGVYLAWRKRWRIRWYWPAIVTVVLAGLLLAFPAVQNPDLFMGLGWGENQQSIPPKPYPSPCRIRPRAPLMISFPPLMARHTGPTPANSG